MTKYIDTELLKAEIKNWGQSQITRCVLNIGKNTRNA